MFAQNLFRAKTNKPIKNLFRAKTNKLIRPVPINPRVPGSGVTAAVRKTAGLAKYSPADGYQVKVIVPGALPPILIVWYWPALSK